MWDANVSHSLALNIVRGRSCNDRHHKIAHPQDRGASRARRRARRAVGADRVMGALALQNPLLPPKFSTGYESSLRRFVDKKVYRWWM